MHICLKAELSSGQKNMERDEKVRELLNAQQIKILIVWECTVKKMIKSKEYENKLLDQMENFLISDYTFCEL